MPINLKAKMVKGEKAPLGREYYISVKLPRGFEICGWDGGNRLIARNIKEKEVSA